MLRSRLVLLVTAVVLLIGGVASRADWPRFRGPNGTGVAESAAPVEFGADKNLSWKAKLPGRGLSSPIVVGNRVFVTCYSGYGMPGEEGRMEDLKRHLVCIDRISGETLWTKTIPAKQPEDRFEPPGVATHGYASHTPASDGERVFTFFGKSGVYAFDLEGNELWNQSVGTGSAGMGFGSAASPIVFKDYVIVNAAYEDEAVVWLDRKTGEVKHRAESGLLVNSWSTPVVIASELGPELVLSVPDEIWGFNADSGKLRWYARGTSDRNAQISPLAANGVVYVVGGRGGEAFAVRPGGKGDVNATNVVWEGRAQGRYATPLLYEGRLFTVNGSVVTCIDAATGEQLGRTRLEGDEESGQTGRRGGGRGRFGGGGDYASPVLADGKIYITMGSGTIYVVSADPELKLLATNDVTFDSSGFGATPAISDGQLFLRSNTHLYCVEK